MHMTKERLEHELLKLKTQFPADHVGAHRILMDQDGRTCIWGQIILNTFPGTGYFNIGNDIRRSAFLFDQSVRQTVCAMIEMNNVGMPWHQIIDKLVPPTAIEVADVEAATLSEPSFAKTPKPEVDVVHA